MLQYCTTKHHFLSYKDEKNRNKLTIKWLFMFKSLLIV